MDPYDEAGQHDRSGANADVVRLVASLLDVIAALHARIDQLHTALNSRVVVEHARALMEREGIQVDVAFERLRQAVRSTRRPIRKAASGVPANGALAPVDGWRQSSREGRRNPQEDRDKGGGTPGIPARTEDRNLEEDAMPDFDTVNRWRDRKLPLIDTDGAKVGTIGDVYLDTETGQPEWALVDTGLLGTKSSFVPLTQAREVDQGLQVPYTKAQIKDAPGPAASGELAPEDEARLYDHYSLAYSTAEPGSGLASEASTDAGGAEVGGRDDAMTRSEEELRVGTQARERGRARLRKYVTTEQVQQTVPVRREEARLEREPITDANVDAAMAGPELTEGEHEVVLREERPVVDKQVVPRERVRLAKEAVTEEEQVAEEVRTEHIDYDGPDDPGTQPRR
jgi:uncharacterized protein (TIGR02271 family)